VINRREQFKQLPWLIVKLLIVGFLVGAALAVYRVAVSGDWSYGLWRTVAATITGSLNRSCYGAFSLGLFLALPAAAQIALGRSYRLSVTTALGVVLFFPLFFSAIWIVTNIGVSQFNIETHKLPEIVRKNDDFLRFLNERFFQYLDALRIAGMLVFKAGWMWPALLLAGLFGAWFGRLAPDRRPDRPPRRRFRLLLALCLMGAVVLLANLFSLAAKVTTAGPRPNVILISIDTLRADRLSCYNPQAPAARALDQLAQKGVVFEEVVSNSAWTLPGHGAMLAGVQPTSLGLFKVTDRLSSHALTIPEVLREYGYRTAAVVSYILLDRVYGFDQGFDHFDYGDNQSAEQVVDKAIAYLDARRKGKYFLFLHFYDPHWPYEPTAESARQVWPRNVPRALRELINTTDFAKFAIKVITGSPMKFHREYCQRLDGDNCQKLFLEYCRAMYDGEIRDVDLQIERLLRHLVNRGLDADTIVVVTSDHGEEFLEHGLLGHGLTLYDEALRVPLIVCAPGLLPAGARIKGQVQMLDLFPTLLGLVGLDASRYPLGGRDLTQMVAFKEIKPEPMLAETSMSGDPRFALRTGEAKLLTPFKLEFTLPEHLHIGQAEEVYDLKEDPGEQANLAGTKTQMALALRRQMEEQLERIKNRWGMGERFSRSKALTGAEEERLRSLGYIN